MAQAWGGTYRLTRLLERAPWSPLSSKTVSRDARGTMRYLITVVIVSFIIIGCHGDGGGAKARSTDREQPAAASAEPSAGRAAGPVDVPYTVINETALPGVKRSLDVRLSEKVSKETLRTLALELKSKDQRDYKRTFIDYYLPGMEVGAGAWATTHFTPDLEVRILGSTVEEQQALEAAPVPDGREIVGQWIDDRPFFGVRLTLYRKEGTLYMEQRFKDGSSGVDEVREDQSRLGRRFEKSDGSGEGDYWLIDSHGDLQIRDGEGLIATARRIE